MKKILFNDKFQLTQAVLDGRKTQTRRIINPQPEVSERMGMVWKGYAYGITSPYGSPCFLKDVYHNFLSGTNYPQCRRYKVGEMVAVAQSYNDCGYDGNTYLGVEGGWVPFSETAGWTNKMFTLADQMQHFIRITDVRVERLNDISESDCLAEGVLHSDKYAMPYGIPDRKAPNGVDFYYSTPREAYAALIDKVSGKGTWARNPYVFVYDFELVK